MIFWILNTRTFWYKSLHCCSALLKNKNVKDYIFWTIKDSQEISTDLSSLGSRLGLQEIWSNFNDKNMHC